MEDRDVVKLWLDRTEAAVNEKANWEKAFRVGDCKAYYVGQQLEKPLDEAGDRKMVINKVGSSVDTTIPSLVFRHPYVRIAGKPERADTPGQSLDQRAQLLQDTANSIVRDPFTQFNEQTQPALKEAFWAFGLVETGHSATFDENPDADKKPALKEDEQSEVENPLPQVVSESFYVKHIPAKCFVSAKKETSVVSELDWLGYYEWVNIEDVKKAPAYEGRTRGLKATGYDPEKDGDQKDSKESKVKLWKLWDQRTKTRLVIADGHDRVLLSKPYKHLPLHLLRFSNQTDSVYPIPPIYSMLGPQDEYNDSRDMLRKLRKAIVPRYTFDQQALDPVELEKFETGDIGVYIPIINQNPSPINPVNQPSFSEGVVASLSLAGKEFTEMSGTSPESRQSATSTTATQAQIVNQRQQIAESFDRQTVAIWLASIAKGLLQCAIDYMIVDHWILRNSDPYSDAFMADAQNIQGMYQQITFQELQEANSVMRWDVSVDMDSLSPASEMEKRQAWNSAIQLMANPAVAKILAISPDILKRTLELNGVQSAREQAMIGQALNKLAALEMQMAMASGKVPQTPGISGQAAPSNPSAQPQPAGPPQPGSAPVPMRQPQPQPQAQPPRPPQ